MRVLIACIALVPVGPTASRADDDVKNMAELKWARGVADDFLAAMKKGETENAVGLLTAEYTKSIAGKGSAAEGLDWAIIILLVEAKMPQRLHGAGGKAAAAHQAIAPVGGELRTRSMDGDFSTAGQQQEERDQLEEQAGPDRTAL